MNKREIVGMVMLLPLLLSFLERNYGVGFLAGQGSMKKAWLGREQ